MAYDVLFAALRHATESKWSPDSIDILLAVFDRSTLGPEQRRLFAGLVQHEDRMRFEFMHFSKTVSDRTVAKLDRFELSRAMSKFSEELIAPDEFKTNIEKIRAVCKEFKELASLGDPVLSWSKFVPVTILTKNNHLTIHFDSPLHMGRRAVCFGGDEDLHYETVTELREAIRKGIELSEDLSVNAEASSDVRMETEKPKESKKGKKPRKESKRKRPQTKKAKEAKAADSSSSSSSDASLSSSDEPPAKRLRARK